MPDKAMSWVCGSAFWKCPILAVNSMGKDSWNIAEVYANGFSFDFSNNTISMAAYCGTSMPSDATKITIPSTINGYPVKQLNTKFLGPKVIEVILPNTITTIKDGAFTNLTALKTVNLPNSITTIGASAFSGCIGLASISIPNSVTSVGASAFSGCTNLNTINLSSKMTVLEASLLYNCTGLTSVMIPTSVTQINSQCFYGCTGLTSLNDPATVTTIGSNAFYNVPHIYYTGAATGTPWGAKVKN